MIEENLHFDDQSKQVNFLFASQYFLKEIENMFSIFLLSYRSTHEKVWENSKKPACRVPTAFLVLRNFRL